MIIDCIGCLHGAQPILDGGDLLIVTGDITKRDKPSEWDDLLFWIHELDYKKKILIAGNHDNVLQSGEQKFFDYVKKLGIEYLQDSGTEFEGLKIWGNPWSAQFPRINPKCCAFTVRYSDNTNELLAEHWKKIPEDTDILITHTPPFGVLDGIPVENGSLFHVGSSSLTDCIMELKQLKLHAFSHIHEAYGKIGQSVNCSIMNERYQPVNAPIRIIL